MTQKQKLAVRLAEAYAVDALAKYNRGIYGYTDEMRDAALDLLEATSVSDAGAAFAPATRLACLLGEHGPEEGSDARDSDALYKIAVDLIGLDVDFIVGKAVTKLEAAMLGE